MTYQDIPTKYPLCFNAECAKKTSCMHYQAQYALPAGRHHGPAVYPVAWQNGACQYFREKRLVQKAWGFSRLYDNVPRHQQSDARHCVSSYFSGGWGPYYRYHHGEKQLSPSQQHDILAILASYDSTDGIRFDHYVEDWDFS